MDKSLEQRYDDLIEGWTEVGRRLDRMLEENQYWAAQYDKLGRRIEEVYNELVLLLSEPDIE